MAPNLDSFGRDRVIYQEQVKRRTAEREARRYRMRFLFSFMCLCFQDAAVLCDILTRVAMFASSLQSWYVGQGCSCVSQLIMEVYKTFYDTDLKLLKESVVNTFHICVVSAGFVSFHCLRQQHSGMFEVVA